jgi:hypothetical protein
MATEIFGKTPRNVVGGFSVDKATLTFPSLGADGKSSGLLIQNLQLSYQQQVSFVYDLAKADDVYYIAGRASGTLALGKIVGSKGIVKSFYTTFGNVCNVKGKNLELSGVAGCDKTDVDTNTITIREPVIAQFGLTMNVDTAIIGENVQMIFSTMELA